jgi:exonuclease III
LEICAIERETKLSKLTGDFNQFIKHLDDAVKHLHKSKAELLICGDINTDHLIREEEGKKKLASLVTTYNLSHKVNLTTRIQNSSTIAIGNIFVDNRRLNLSSVSPIINGLSDHDAQILTIKNNQTTIIKFPLKQRTR